MWITYGFLSTTNRLLVPPAHAKQVYLFLCPSVCPSVRAKRGIWSKRVFIRTNSNFSFSVHWRNTTIILIRKFLIFLRNDRDCKAVDLYNARRRYAVIESLDPMRNISWLASYFSKIKNPNKQLTQPHNCIVH